MPAPAPYAAQVYLRLAQPLCHGAPASFDVDGVDAAGVFDPQNPRAAGMAPPQVWFTLVSSPAGAPQYSN